MLKIYKLLKLLDFNTFLFEKKKTSGERVKENVAYPKWNNHFLHNIFYGVVLGGIIINSPAFLLELFFNSSLDVDFEWFWTLVSYPLAFVVFILSVMGFFNKWFHGGRKKQFKFNSSDSKMDKGNILDGLFETHEKADHWVFTVYIAALFSHTYKIYQYDKFAALASSFIDEKMYKESMRLFYFFLDGFSEDDSFKIFEKMNAFTYKIHENKVFFKPDKTIESPYSNSNQEYELANDIVQLCFKAKTVLDYQQKSSLVSILKSLIINFGSNFGSTVINFGSSAIEPFGVFLGLDRATISGLHWQSAVFPNSRKLTKNDIFESSYFLDIHYKSKEYSELQDDRVPSFKDLLQKAPVNDASKTDNVADKIKESLSQKSNLLLLQLQDQQVIFDDEMSRKFSPIEITYQRYNRAFKQAHAFGVANILDIDRLEELNENLEDIKEKKTLHERLLQEMEEVNGALRKLKGVLFEDDQKLKDMLQELDFLTQNIEKYTE